VVHEEEYSPNTCEGVLQKYQAYTEVYQDILTPLQRKEVICHNHTMHKLGMED
jgi:hypothetical protein